MDDIVAILFFAGLGLCILFGPWVLLIRTGIKRRREREEDQGHLSQLTVRVFALESAVRELKRPAVAPAPPPVPVQPEEAKPVTTAPLQPPIAPMPTSARTTAEAWVTKTGPP